MYMISRFTSMLKHVLAFFDSSVNLWNSDRTKVLMMQAIEGYDPLIMLPFNHYARIQYPAPAFSYFSHI